MYRPEWGETGKILEAKQQHRGWHREVAEIPCGLHVGKHGAWLLYPTHLWLCTTMTFFFFFNVFFQYYSVAHSSVVIWIWNYVPRGKSSCLCTASWKSWYFWSVRLLFIHLFIYLNLNFAVHPSVKRGTAEFSICNASVFSLAGRGKMWAWEGRIQHPALLLA